MNEKFKVELLEEVVEFLNELDEKARDKIIYNLRKAQIVNDNVWEFRTLHNKTKYRLFAFWDKTDKSNTVVISTHAIIKKTAKIPTKEIAKTEKIMAVYFEAKK